jgi:hypothetical protein
MYIDSISLENIRTFAAGKTIPLVHPDTRFKKSGDGRKPKPRLRNVNLLFGENASGKTTLLECVALAALGPAITDSRIAPRPLVRFVPRTRRPTAREKKGQGQISASLVLHGAENLSPDLAHFREGASRITVTQKGELESFEFQGSDHIHWDTVYWSRNESFFVVAYGATRRVEPKSDIGLQKRNSSSFVRVNRVESIVQEGYPLVPFQAWLPRLKKKTGRWQQVIDLINGALGRGHFSFEGQQVNDDYVFSQGGLDIPFRSLSDGYRAFLGWVGDLVYHLDFACRHTDDRLAEVPGVVLVDEIDLHLHPRWQMEVVHNLSKTFPRLQFIFTSHSPLVAGSVEWMNITRLRLDNQHRTGIDPFEQPIHGLDADQILVSDLFGLESTRAEPKRARLHELTIRARRGDDEAAKQLISEMAKGLESAK